MQKVAFLHTFSVFAAVVVFIGCENQGTTTDTNSQEQGNDGIVFKLVYNRLNEGKLLLVSSNRNYLPYEIQVSQVLEIWQFETWNSFEFNA